MMSRLLPVLVVVLLAGCQGDDGEGWTPVLEEAPPTYLEAELVRISAAVEGARSSLVEAPESAESELEEAAARLESLSAVYLPLYRSRVAAANAYRQYELGRTADALASLEVVNAAILAVSERTGGALERELEGVAEHAARARVSVSGDAPTAATHLRGLTETLSDLVTRADLLL